MKRFLLPLIASLALPTTVNAETWWLMAAGKAGGGTANTGQNWAIPTNSEQECEFAGQKFLNASFPSVLSNKARGYVCVKGK